MKLQDKCYDLTNISILARLASFCLLDKKSLHYLDGTRIENDRRMTFQRQSNTVHVHLARSFEILCWIDVLEDTPVSFAVALTVLHYHFPRHRCGVRHFVMVVRRLGFPLVIPSCTSVSSPMIPEKYLQRLHNTGELIGGVLSLAYGENLCRYICTLQ